jgi:pyridoxal phosphate-dependent aminotransferase EpsN
VRSHKRVYLIGCGGHAKVVAATLLDAGYDVAAVFDDDSARWRTTLSGIPIVGPIDAVKQHERLPAVIAIGSNRIRKGIAERLDLEWLTVVHPKASVDASVELGQGTVVFAGAVIQPDTRVGDHAIVNTAASVDHDCLVGDFVHLAPGVHLAGGVSVGDGAFLGIGSTAVPGAEIGAWATVGAGASVLENVPREVVVVGVPARPVVRRSASPVVPADGADIPTPTVLQREESEPIPETVDEAEAKELALDRPDRIYLSPPHMSPRERELLLEAFDSNWIAPLGPHVDEFEEEFAAKVGAAHAVALASGTAGLHLALLVLGVGRGDEVFCSTLTFAATANAITYAGARPVFIDSDRDTWNMDPDLLAEELETRAKQGRLPKAVICVDLYGQCADYERIAKTCRFYDVPLVEDAAEALGATYRGQSAGSFGLFGIFSFNGNKIITTSGGGMLVTERKDLAERIRHLATQARDPAPHYEHSEIGYNYRMSNLLAAVGRGQLSVLDTRVEQRRANFEYYREALGDVPGIAFMPEIAGGRSTRWLTCITVDPDRFGATAEDIRRACERENIEARPVWKPMHLQPVFAECDVVDGAVADDLFSRGLCLPSGSSLTDQHRQRVVEGVRSVHVPQRAIDKTRVR